jgi:hypothetical protein
MSRPINLYRSTPLVPQAVAGSVMEEASTWLGTDLPKEWTVALANKAVVLYASHRRFRCLVSQSGDRGREWLWAFMRHWLSALVYRYNPGLYNRLPASYSAGGSLAISSIGTKAFSRASNAKTRPVRLSPLRRQGSKEAV